MHRTISILILGFIAGGCTWQPPALSSADDVRAHEDGRMLSAGRSRAAIDSITFEDFFLLHQSGELLLFDARPAFSYHHGHIPGAIHLHAHKCGNRIEEFKPLIEEALASGKTIVVYCSGPQCRDARTLSRALAYDGFPVSVFHDGWAGWKNADLPAESASHPPLPSATPSAP